jgi:hypothetical protein
VRQQAQLPFPPSAATARQLTTILILLLLLPLPLLLATGEQQSHRWELQSECLQQQQQPMVRPHRARWSSVQMQRVWHPVALARRLLALQLERHRLR